MDNLCWPGNWFLLWVCCAWMQDKQTAVWMVNICTSFIPPTLNRACPTFTSQLYVIKSDESLSSHYVARYNVRNGTAGWFNVSDVLVNRSALSEHMLKKGIAVTVLHHILRLNENNHAICCMKDDTAALVLKRLLNIMNVTIYDAYFVQKLSGY